MIICAGKNEKLPGVLSIGVGLIDSAINLTKIVQKNRPKKIIFIGSAGSYGSYKPFDVVTSTIATQIEHSYINNSSYTPLNDLIFTNVSHETMAIINSSNYITTDEKIAKKMLNLGIDLENMEFFSVVKVAKKYNIEVLGAFVVTNYCNNFANKDFVKNHKKALKIMENLVEKYR